jgi:hypothetical protein
MGNAMNGKELLPSCWHCICVKKEMCEVNREVASALKQYFIMRSVPPICQSSASVWAYPNLRNSKDRIMLLTHMEFSPYPRIFIRSVQSWNKGVFKSLMGKFKLFVNTFYHFFSGFECQWGQDFPHPSRPEEVHIQPPVKWIPGVFPRCKVNGAWCWRPTPV